MSRRIKRIMAFIRLQVGRIRSRLNLFMKKIGVRFSLLAALFLTIACYFVNNLPIIPGDVSLQYMKSQQIRDLLGWHKNVNYGNVVFFNTSYDIELVPAIDYHNTDIPETVGVNAITDREKLSTFLELLQKSNKYKFVIIDLLFDDNDKSEYDDTLYNRIINMRDIVVANGYNICLPSKLSNKNKDALASYYISTSNTSFERYEYTEDDIRSIPLFVYESLHPERKMNRYGIGRFSIYFSENHLCQNANYLLFDSYLTKDNNEWTESTDDFDFFVPDYINIGSFLNELSTDVEKINYLADSTDSRVVIIGDFIHDTHDTYMGEKPGPLIMARALQTLEERKNRVSFGHTCLWFFVFSLICFFIYRDKPLSMYIPLIKKIPYKFVHMVFSLITVTVVLIFCSFIEFAFFDKVFSLIIPVAFFTILKLFIQYRKFDTL